jgi:hypothetical protein
MTPNFQYFLISLALLIASILLTGCTTVSYKTLSGTEVSIKKFTPFGGEDLSIEGTLEGIGTLSVNKKTEDSQVAAQSLADSLIKIATP